MSDEQSSRPSEPIRPDRGQREDEAAVPTLSTTASRWLQLAAELENAAGELASSTRPRADLREHIGRLCCVEALSQRPAEQLPRG